GAADGPAHRGRAGRHPRRGGGPAGRGDRTERAAGGRTGEAPRRPGCRHRREHVPGDGAARTERAAQDRRRGRGRPRARRAPRAAVHGPVSERPASATPTWNLLATSLEGQRESLLYGLRKLARFRRGGFPNVLVAKVDDPRAFLDELHEAHDRMPMIRAGIGKAIPIERMVRFAGPDTFVDDVAAALPELLDRITGRT